jgi:hypothetical protein
MTEITSYMTEMTSYMTEMTSYMTKMTSYREMKMLLITKARTHILNPGF